jgi:hypothetical protein
MPNAGAVAAELPGAGTIAEAMVLHGMFLAIGGIWSRRKRGRDGDY